MKIIGLIGGMSAESTVTYYRTINATVRGRLGGGHSAKCLLYSVDFQEIEECQSAGEWDKSAEILSDAARRLERGGADFVVLCTNTMHKVADRIQGAVSIPVLHIAEATAQRLTSCGARRVALLGTKYTMEQDFYKSILTGRGIEVMIPDGDDREFVHSVIYDELCLGVISESSRQRYLQIIDRLLARGAQGVILGCTEIGLLVRQKDTKALLFDTALIHAQSAALYSMDV